MTTFNILISSAFVSPNIKASCSSEFSTYTCIMVFCGNEPPGVTSTLLSLNEDSKINKYFIVHTTIDFNYSYQNIATDFPYCAFLQNEELLKRSFHAFSPLIRYFICLILPSYLRMYLCNFWI